MSDLISRQAAIDTLVRDCKGSDEGMLNMYDIICDLKELPSAQPKSLCNTCRYTNLEWYEEPCDSCTMGGESNHYKPSAQRTGEWIPLRDDDGLNIGGGELVKFNGEQVYYCSECKVCKYKSSGGFMIPVVIKFPHCPNCGADMRGDDTNGSD